MLGVNKIGVISQRLHLRTMLVETFPMAIFSQLERLDFSGKKL
jgi:hypothetical protein